MALGPSVAETHVSTVFFTDDRAYKLLKPIATSFLDHSTVELRLEAVDQEVDLNRRMAPEVYLGTADVVENGAVVDRMIVMRRLPSARRLTRLIGCADGSACVRAVARKVAVFHAAQPPVRSFDGQPASQIAGRDAVRKNWYDNLADLEPFVGSVLPGDEVARVRELLDRYLDHRDSLFEHRLEAGFVRDGHGDLTAEDTFCLPDGPQILDCLAFDPRLRIADVLADVAFLAMDLDRLAGPGPAQDFIDLYSQFSNEHHPASLAHHYVAYRAHVRAKVAAIRHSQGDTGAADQVREYHALCLRRLEHADLKVILIGGTPGTGKSTLARGLSTTLGSMVLSSDEIRKDLAGRGHLDRDFSPTDEGIYSPAMHRRTYAELLRRAVQLLDRGESVILDASWGNEEHRQAARTMAATNGGTLAEIECVLDASVADARIAGRLAEGNDPSDARPEVTAELRRRYAPWPSATQVDTADAPDDVAVRAAAAIAGR